MFAMKLAKRPAAVGPFVTTPSLVACPRTPAVDEVARIEEVDDA